MRRTLVMEPHWIPSSVSGTEIWQGSASECGVNCHCREAGSRETGDAESFSQWLDQR